MDFESEVEAKLFFARMLYKRPKDSLQIAKQVLGETLAKEYPLEILRLSDEWPNDPIVLEELDRLSKTLLEKEVVINQLYERANTYGVQVDEYTRLMRLYCEVRGFVGRVEPIASKTGEDKLQQLIDAMAD